MKKIVVFLLIALSVTFFPIFHAFSDDEPLEYSTEPTPEHDNRYNLSPMIQSIISGEIKSNAKTRKQFAKIFKKQLATEKVYQGIQVQTSGKNSTVLKLSFPRANAIISAAIASQPDMTLVFYGLGFNKIIFSNNDGDEWVFPIKLN